MPDYYAILNVAPESEDIVITAAYRALMRKYHPDSGAPGISDDQAKLINEAHAVLSDPQKRAAYDRQRNAERARSAGGAGNAQAGQGTGAASAGRQPPRPRPAAKPSTPPKPAKRPGFFERHRDNLIGYGIPVLLVIGLPAGCGYMNHRKAAEKEEQQQAKAAAHLANVKQAQECVRKAMSPKVAPDFIPYSDDSTVGYLLASAKAHRAGKLDLLDVSAKTAPAFRGAFSGSAIKWSPVVRNSGTEAITSIWADFWVLDVVGKDCRLYGTAMALSGNLRIAPGEVKKVNFETKDADTPNDLPEVPAGGERIIFATIN